MSQNVVPEVESPVEATEAEAVKSDAAPQESQEAAGDAPATQEKPESTPVPSQQAQEEAEPETDAVKRSAEELSQASQEEVATKKVRVLEGGDNAQSQEVPAEV